MQTDNRLFDDLAHMANGAFGSLHGVRQDVEARFKRIVGDMDLVSREEFEAVKAMAAKAREENEALQKRITELEARTASPETAAEDQGATPPAEDD